MWDGFVPAEGIIGDLWDKEIESGVRLSRSLLKGSPIQHCTRTYSSVSLGIFRCVWAADVAVRNSLSWAALLLKIEDA